MQRKFHLWITVFFVGAISAGCAPSAARAQEPYQFESDLVAKKHLFPSVSAGIHMVRRGPGGSYYVLAAPAPAVMIHDSKGARAGQVPSDAASKIKGTALVYGESFDVDQDGRVAVCDRGANAVKIYGADGSLAASIPVHTPVSVVFLSGGELAVSSPSYDHLVTVYDLTGKTTRDFGDREEIADRAEVNSQVNFGHLAADAAGNTYYSFDFLPEPTVRKFDRAGYLSMEISLATPEFQPAAQAARKAIARSDTGVPSLHRIISALGVDPQDQELWVAIGTLLMHFDKEGQRIASFRTYMPDGARLEPSFILVEPTRLIMGSDPLGAYEFPKPPRLPQ